MKYRRWSYYLAIAAISFVLLVALLDDKKNSCGTDVIYPPIYGPEGFEGYGLKQVELDCPLLDRVIRVAGFDSEWCAVYAWKELVTQTPLGPWRQLIRGEVVGRKNTLTCQAVRPMWIMIGGAIVLFTIGMYVNEPAQKPRP